MATEDLLSIIDAEIARLVEVRKILEGGRTEAPGDRSSSLGWSTPTIKKPGPKPGSHHKKPGAPATGLRRWGGKPEPAETKRHIITPAGRARIAQATRQRWAALRKVQPGALRLVKLP